MSIYRLVCLSGVLLAVAGCKKAEEKTVIEPGDLAPDAIVAKVDDTTLTFADMDQRASGYLKYAVEKENVMFATNMLPHAKEYYRKRAINTFVYKTLMLNEAARLNVTVNEKEREARFQTLEKTLAQRQSNTNRFFNGGPQSPDVMYRDFEDEMVISKMISQEVQKRIKVMDEEVEQMAAEIDATNAVRRATLEAARKQILDGAPFEDVARTISEDTPSAKRGGDIGEFAQGKYKEDTTFEDAAFALPLDKVSEVVETKFGYHLIKVTAHNPAQPEKDGAPAVPETVRASHILIKSLPTNRSQIASTLYRRKMAEGSLSLFEELKEKANIECPMFSDMKYEPVSGAR